MVFSTVLTLHRKSKSRFFIFFYLFSFFVRIFVIVLYVWSTHYFVCSTLSYSCRLDRITIEAKLAAKKVESDDTCRLVATMGSSETVVELDGPSSGSDFIYEASAYEKQEYVPCFFRFFADSILFDCLLIYVFCLLFDCLLSVPDRFVYILQHWRKLGHLPDADFGSRRQQQEGFLLPARAHHHCCWQRVDLELVAPGDIDIHRYVLFRTINVLIPQDNFHPTALNDEHPFTPLVFSSVRG